jgi:hypothetical protein
VIGLDSGARTDLFRYDPSSPLRFAVVEQGPRGEVVLARVRYDNGVGGLVRASGQSCLAAVGYVR